MGFLVVTAEHLERARKAGACAEALRRYKPGTPLSDVSAEDLQWYEAYFPDEAAEIAATSLRDSGVEVRGRVALALLGSGSGSGYGYGYGSGRGVARA